MGGIRKSRKKYDNPRKRWDKTRIEEEKDLTKTYGIKEKQELRVLQTFVRKKRLVAKDLLAMPLEMRLKREKELVKSLARYGFLQENATLDDVFGLEIREVLEKRLQTLVWRQNLAKTVMQARQFIVHGHIAIAGAKMTSPNYLVPAEKVEKIGYFGGKQLQLEPLKPEKTEEQKKEFEEAGQEAQETGEELEGGVIEDAE